MGVFGATMSAEFLAGASIGLRECMEAVLIVGLLVSYLSKTDRRSAISWVWAGVGAGILLSVVTGAAIAVLFGSLSIVLEFFEGITMLLAAVVLAGVLMHLVRHQGKLELESWIDDRYAQYNSIGISAVTALCVWREGAETVLFTLALGDATAGFMGVAVGISAAAGIGWALFSGLMKVNIRWVFRITNLSLLAFGAHLFSTGFWEFVEAGVWGLEETTVTMIIRVLLFVGYLVLIGYAAAWESNGASKRDAAPM